MILLDWVRAHNVAIKDGASCQERLWLFFVSQPGAVFIVADLPSLPYLYLELYGTLPYIPTYPLRTYLVKFWILAPINRRGFVCPKVKYLLYIYLLSVTCISVDQASGT